MTESDPIYHLRFTDARTTPGDWEFSDGMTIGYFSTEAKALEALDAVRTLPGFREDINGFTITPYLVGATRFDHGFDPRDDEAVVDKWLNEE